MATLLSAAELEAALSSVPGWSGDTAGISRSFSAPEFLTGVRLVDAVADQAEKVDHHPDIDIRWRTVRFRLVTHSEGGVTGKDIDLARQINDIAGQHGCT